MTFFLMSFSYSFVHAQALLATVNKDTIDLNETVTLSVSGKVVGIPRDIEIPPCEGLIATSKTGTYDQLNGSGKFSINSEIIFQPVKTGTFVIGPVYIQSGSKRFFANTVAVVVTSTSSNPASKDNVFLVCEPNIKNPVIGQQVVLSIKFCWRPGTHFSLPEGLDDKPTAGSFTGFWYNTGPFPCQKPEDTVITIHGIKFNCLTIYKEYVFPNVSGRLNVPSYKYTCSIKQNPFPTPDDLINELMGIPTDVELKSDPFAIDVKPLPTQNKPDDFFGDVGVFSLSAGLDRSRVKANQAVKLTVTISGNGNLSFVQLPPRQAVDGIDFFPATSVDNSRISENGMEGDKTFSITFIPKKEGNYQIPGVSFSYYDPSKKDFVSLKTPDFNLQVSQGDSVSTVSENNLPQTFFEQNSFMSRKMKWVLLIVGQLLLVFFLGFLWLKRKRKNKIEPQYAEASSSDSVQSENNNDKVFDLIREAESNSLQSNFSLAISNLHEALLLSICNKCELAKEEVSGQQIRHRLKSKKIDASLIDEVINGYEELSLLRYSALLNRSLFFEKLENCKKLINSLVA